MKLLIVGMLSFFCAATAARAQDIAPVVVELFTSQSCSSCPRADKILSELAQEEDVIALSCHVTYWDNLGWKDTLSQPFCTQRQEKYRVAMGERNLYTPQMIVNGQHAGNGSNIFSVRSMMGKARKTPLHALSALYKDGTIDVELPPMEGGNEARAILIGFDETRTEKIGSGENGGKTVAYTNPVTSLEIMGVWDGKPAILSYNVKRRATRYVVLLQKPNGTLAAASRPFAP
ncbi:MAG TPA: DUF1223 domain-containing protein [Alphaproteobacteria bacterium]